MQVLRLQIKPVLASGDMRQGIRGVRMQDHFRATGGAGGEVDEGGIGAAGRRWRECLTGRGHCRIIGHPPRPGATNDNKMLQGRTIGPHRLDLRGIGLIHNDDARLGHVDAILKILRC